MFLNGAPPTSTIRPNNENASSLLLHRSKSLGETGGKKGLSVNENAMKTPHRSRKDGAASSTTKSVKSGRRRALGDISNRKAGGGGANVVDNGNGKLGLKPVSKPTSGSLQGLRPSSNRKSDSIGIGNTNGKVTFATPSAVNRFQPIKQSKLTVKPKIGGVPENEKFILPKRTSNASTATKSNTTTSSHKLTDYDGVFEKTTRWASNDIHSQGLGFNVSREALFEATDCCHEAREIKYKESLQREREEQKYLDEQYEEMLKMATKDVEECLRDDALRGLDDLRYSLELEDGNEILDEKDKFTLPKRISNTSAKATATSSNTSTATKSNTTKSSTTQSSIPNDYDGVFGKTTRWADEDIHSQGLGFNVSKEELFEGAVYCQEAREQTYQEYLKREREEEKHLEDQYEEMLKKAHDDVLNCLSDDTLHALDELRVSLEVIDGNRILDFSFEEEVIDPAEDRRVRGSDPFSMWGDIDNY